MATGGDATRACDGSVGAPFSGVDVSAVLNLEAPPRPGRRRWLELETVKTPRIFPLIYR